MKNSFFSCVQYIYSISIYIYNLLNAASKPPLSASAMSAAKTILIRFKYRVLIKQNNKRQAVWVEVAVDAVAPLPPTTTRPLSTFLWQCLCGFSSFQGCLLACLHVSGLANETAMETAGRQAVRVLSLQSARRLLEEESLVLVLVVCAASQC